MKYLLFTILTIFGGSSDAFFGNLFFNRRPACSRTCEDIMDDSEDTRECLAEVNFVSATSIFCSFDGRSCRKSCKQLDKPDYCPSRCLNSLGSAPADYNSYETCEAVLEKSTSCQSHLNKCVKQCPEKVEEEIKLECPEECAQFAELDYDQCWTQTKANETCSKHKGCFERCMSDKPCPDDCNISLILGYKACVTFIKEFPTCNKYSDCYGKCPEDKVEEKDDKEEPEKKGLLHKLSNIFNIDQFGTNLDDILQETHISFKKLTNILTNVDEDEDEENEEEEDNEIGEEDDKEDNTESGGEEEEEEEEKNAEEKEEKPSKTKGLLQKLTEMFNSRRLQTNLDDLMQGTHITFNRLTDGFTEVADVYANTLGELADKLNENWKPVEEKLGETSEALVSLFLNGKEVDGIGSNLEEAWENLVDNVGDAFKPIVDGLEPVVDKFEEVGKRLNEKVTDLVTIEDKDEDNTDNEIKEEDDMEDGDKEDGGEITEEDKEEKPSKTKGLLLKITEMFNSRRLQTNLDDLMQGTHITFNRLTDGFTEIADVYANTLDELADKLNQNWKPVEEKLGETSEALVSLFLNGKEVDGFGSNLEEAWDNLVDKVGDAFKPVVDGLEPVVDKFEEAGRRLTDPDAIKETGEDIKQAIGGVENQLKERLNAFGEQTDELADSMFNEEAWKNTGDTLVNTIGDMFSNIIPNGDSTNEDNGFDLGFEIPDLDFGFDNLFRW